MVDKVGEQFEGLYPAVGMFVELENCGSLVRLSSMDDTIIIMTKILSRLLEKNKEGLQDWR